MAHVYMGIRIFKTEICFRILHMTLQISLKHQLPNDDPLTEEQQDNKRKFSDMIANYLNKLS